MGSLIPELGPKISDFEDGAEIRDEKNFRIFGNAILLGIKAIFLSEFISLFVLFHLSDFSWFEWEDDIFLFILLSKFLTGMMI